MTRAATLLLFERAFARATDPRTSHEAAASVNVTDREAIVIAALQRYGDMTVYEIADITKLSLVTVSPRLRPLADKGIVADSGKKRKNVSGRSSIVWRLV